MYGYLENGELKLIKESNTFSVFSYAKGVFQDPQSIIDSIAGVIWQDAAKAKEIHYGELPSYDQETQRLVTSYEEDERNIYVNYSATDRQEAPNA